MFSAQKHIGGPSAAVAGDANVANPRAMDGHFGPAAAVESGAGGAWLVAGWWLVVGGLGGVE